MPVDASRRHELLSAKLAGLVRAQWGDDAVAGERAQFRGGAALRSGNRGWILAEEAPERAMGGAVAWADRFGVGELHLLAPAAAGVLARRAAYFRVPPAVWAVRGTAIEPAEVEPFSADRELPEGAEEFLEDFEMAGVEPVVEHGVLLAEILGLEVARVVEGPDGEPVLEVGVGKHDREAHRLVHGNDDPRQALVRSAELVRRLRTAGAPPQPANRISPERWLRCVVVAHPALVGAAHLEPVPPVLLRTDLRVPAPAPAVGADLDGGPMVVVCSTGFDPDVVAAGADARARHAPAAPLVIVVPEGDDQPVVRDVAARLRHPATVVTVPAEWRRLGPALP